MFTLWSNLNRSVVYFGEEKRDLRIVGDPNSFPTRSANHEAAQAECTDEETGHGCKQLKLRRGEWRHTYAQRASERERETETERQSAKQREQER